MNTLKNNSSVRRYELLIYAVLLAIGIFFRVIESGNYPFNFDQVQILSKAEEISQGQLSLIGPRTGPADLFTGPLIYYLTAFFIKILPLEYLVVTIPTLIAVATAVIVAICIRKDFAFRETVVFLIFWAFSPYLIQLDRVFWNPNFMFLAATLSFLPLIHAQKKHFSLDRALLVSVGGFLGYQAHFAGLALPGLVLLVVILFRKNAKYAVASVLGLFLSLVPTLVFDIRNNWLNTRGVISLLTRSSSEGNMFSLIQEFGSSLFILVENTGKILFWGQSGDSIITAGVVVLLIAVTFARNRMQLLLACTWLLAIAVFFSVYPGNKPEYYYILSIPAIFIFFFSIARKVALLPLSIALILFGILSTTTNLRQLGPNGSLSLGSTVFVHKKVSEIAQSQGGKQHHLRHSTCR